MGAVLIRYNARITGDSSSDSDEPASTPSASAVRQLSLSTAPLSPLSGPLKSLGYLHRPGTGDDLKAISHWVVADVASQVGHLLSSPHIFQSHALHPSSCMRDCSITPIPTPGGEERRPSLTDM